MRIQYNPEAWLRGYEAGEQCLPISACHYGADLGGRPAKLSAREIKTISALLKTANISVSELVARFGVARSTLYRSVINPVAG